MSKGDKVWVKPGWTTQRGKEYEMLRQKTIRENYAKMTALGLDGWRVGGSECKRMSRGKKRKAGENDDDDVHRSPEGVGENDDDDMYRPLEGDDLLSSSGEDVSTRSPTNEVTNMHLSRKFRARNNFVASDPTPRDSIKRVTQSLGIQYAQPPVTSSPAISSSIALNLSSRSRRVRGMVRGFSAEKLVRQLGHAIPVPIPSTSNAPEGEYTTSFAIELRKEIRAAAPVRDFGWDGIDEGIKEAIIRRVRQRFDIGDYEHDENIKSCIREKCQKRYRDWKHELHDHYKTLLLEGVSNPKNHPLSQCNLADWIWMIDNVWQTEAWKKKSHKAKESRAKSQSNHTCGSKSFAATMSIIRAKNDGQAPPIQDFYRDTHFSKKKNDWVNEFAKEKHEQLVQKTSEQLHPEVEFPITQEEISAHVLGKKSGYLKGFGIRIKPTLSSSTTAQSLARDAEVKDLREQLAEQVKKHATLEAFVRELVARTEIIPRSDTGGENLSSGDKV